MDVNLLFYLLSVTNFGGFGMREQEQKAQVILKYKGTMHNFLRFPCGLVNKLLSRFPCWEGGTWCLQLPNVCLYCLVLTVMVLVVIHYVYYVYCVTN